MSRNIVFLAVLMVASSLGCAASLSTKAQGTSRVDESKEPPVTYVLKVGDQSVPIKEGEPIRLQGTFTDPEVLLTADSIRVFPYQGVEFHYPRAFTFEADLSEADSKSWTLSGNDFKIMFFAMDEQISASQFADNMVDQFGRGKCQVSPAAPLKFGDQQLAGTTLKVTVVSAKMVMDIYRLPASGSQTRLLVLQDNLDDSGNRSAEGTAARDLLSASAKLQP